LKVALIEQTVALLRELSIKAITTKKRRKRDMDNTGVNEIFMNGEGRTVIVRMFEVPSMCIEFDPGGIGYQFFEVDFTKKKMVELNKEEVKTFYKHLVQKKERITFWLIMREINWVGKHKEPYYITDKEWENGHLQGQVRHPAVN
jgi:hypothetical protein